MKATINNIKEIAKANDLEVIETTTGMNGYPQNEKFAVIGFENYEQINDFINGFIINSYPEIFTKKDGWRFWERTGNVAYDAFEFSVDDYGDNYYTFEDDEEEFILLKERLSETESIDEVDKLIATYKELVDKFNEKEDDEVIVTNFGAYYETVKKQSMSTYHDTRSHVIGVVIEELDEVDEIPTYDELHELGGEIIETTDEGCVQLWRLNGKEYVVMPDNSVMSREEDNSFGEVAYFPY